MDRKQQVLRQQEAVNAEAQPEAPGAAGEQSQPRSEPHSSDSDEFNTPEGSVGSSEGEQGPMSPHAC